MKLSFFGGSSESTCCCVARDGGGIDDARGEGKSFKRWGESLKKSGVELLYIMLIMFAVGQYNVQHEFHNARRSLSLRAHRQKEEHQKEAEKKET